MLCIHKCLSKDLNNSCLEVLTLSKKLCMARLNGTRKAGLHWRSTADCWWDKPA